MPADEQIRRFFAKHRYQPGVIVTRITAYVSHQHVHLFYPETVELAERVPYISAVHISEYGTSRLELSQRLQQFKTAYVAGMPDLIHIFEMLQYTLVQQTVRITQNAYSCHLRVSWSISMIASMIAMMATVIKNTMSRKSKTPRERAE